MAGSEREQEQQQEAAQGSLNALDPSIRAIVERAKAEEARTIEAHRASQQAEFRFRRAYAAWLRVYSCKDRFIPDELGGEAYYRVHAELIGELGQVLKKDGWASRIESVATGSDAKTYAVTILRRAMEGDIDTVTAMLREAVATLFHLGLEADQWLREGLMYEVLGIRPAPSPPSGWEGPYHEAVETEDDFIKWIDGEFLIQEMVNRGQGARPSDGHLVRNAYRLVLMLNLTGMPLESLGPFTLNDELAVLRNLRQLLVSKQPEHDAKETDRHSVRPAMESTRSDQDEGTDKRKPPDEGHTNGGGGGSRGRETEALLSGGHAGSRLTINGCIATFDGGPYPIEREQAALLQRLLDAKGNWVSSKELNQSPGLRGKRIDRIVKHLPKPILKVVNSKPGTGYRLVME
ncbi:MAG: hypothetical protein HY000_33505 [Planctomycetes bacterium]|nr:hypothetical protein [Planctomycetota bacterium]